MKGSSKFKPISVILHYPWEYIMATNAFVPLFNRSSLDVIFNVPSITDIQPVNLPSLYQIIPSTSTTYENS